MPHCGVIFYVVYPTELGHVCCVVGEGVSVQWVDYMSGGVGGGSWYNVTLDVGVVEKYLSVQWVDYMSRVVGSGSWCNVTVFVGVVDGLWVIRYHSVWENTTPHCEEVFEGFDATEELGHVCCVVGI